mmetsp:Transcript_16038/g.40361  ORF Transcript_16038/g.40361 Transcript_16038/m.40361 type:complete len:265 (+) Transcript_16038:225-1019(+)
MMISLCSCALSSLPQPPSRALALAAARLAAPPALAALRAMSTGAPGGGEGPTVKERKTALRTALREKLGGLEDAHVLAQSEAVAAKVFALPEYKAARGVACFVSMPKEFQTRRLLEGICADGKTLYLPRVESVKEKTMSMLKADSLGDVDSWPAGRWGIPEPPKDGPPRLEALDEESDLDLIIVPGLAFDAQRRRLGQGAGFYDRWLARGLALRDAPASFSGSEGPLHLVGVTLDELVVGEVPTDDFDVIVSRVVSASNTFPPA